MAETEGVDVQLTTGGLRGCASLSGSGAAPTQLWFCGGAHAGVMVGQGVGVAGYVTVTGLHDGTNVDVRVGSKELVLAGGGISGTGAGGVVSFPISKGEVVRLVGTPETDLALW